MSELKRKMLYTFLEKEIHVMDLQYPTGLILDAFEDMYDFDELRDIVGEMIDADKDYKVIFEYIEDYKREMEARVYEASLP